MITIELKDNPELARRLTQAVNYQMSKAEMAAQRRSWVRGELMLAHPDMTREEADAIIDRFENGERWAA